MKLKWIIFIALWNSVAFAENTPCSGKKDGVSHCFEGKFVCNDGSTSQSKYTCTNNGQNGKTKQSNLPLMPKNSYIVGTDYQVCFTPGQDCTSLIVKEISHANQSIFVQAYSFTSAPIAQALINAKIRGVSVKIILDKSQSKKNIYTSATFLINNHIPTWIDYKPAIAHSKIMIIDTKKVITGSFNFTKAAQYKNAENVLIINNNELAKIYLDNWNNRKVESRLVLSQKLS